MEKILVIEDEESILMALEDDLGLQGLTMAMKQRCDLIILDIMLPKMDGFDVCKQLRQAEVTTPILMLTAKSQEIDKVLGLELGADDYVTKPFSPRELLARVKAILRRVKSTREQMDGYRFGDVEIDFKKYETKKKGRPVYLTSLEFSLIGFLIENREHAVSRPEILDGVWGEDVNVLDKTVDTHISHLRKKIEDDPANPKHIIGVRGRGYKFAP